MYGPIFGRNIVKSKTYLNYQVQFLEIYKFEVGWLWLIGKELTNQ